MPDGPDPLGDPLNGHNGHTSSNGKKKMAGANNSIGLCILVFTPFVMFSVLSCAFVFVYHHFPIVAWLLAGTWVMLALSFVVLDRRQRMSGSWYYALGLLCLFATANAMGCGLYNYWTYLYQYWSYTESRIYTNVLPTEPAQSHEDAGIIMFSETARVDTTRAVGYKAGSVYCVAPIMDETQSDRVEYWAAGIGCCSSRGDFECDDVWNPKARSGAVIIDPLGGDVSVSSEKRGSGTQMRFWKSNWEYYMKAVGQAEANYQMVSSEHPLFVRWVTDPQQFQDKLWRYGIAMLIGSVSIYLLVSIIFGAGMQMYAKRTATQGSAR